MKILTREHSLRMARLIAEHEGEKIDANELTIDNPIVHPNGDVDIYVVSLDSFNRYKFVLWSDGNLDILECIRGD